MQIINKCHVWNHALSPDMSPMHYSFRASQFRLAVMIFNTIVKRNNIEDMCAH